MTRSSISLAHLSIWDMAGRWDKWAGIGTQQFIQRSFVSLAGLASRLVCDACCFTDWSVLTMGPPDFQGLNLLTWLAAVHCNAMVCSAQHPALISRFYSPDFRAAAVERELCAGHRPLHCTALPWWCGEKNVGQTEGTQQMDTITCTSFAPSLPLASLGHWWFRRHNGCCSAVLCTALHCTARHEVIFIALYCTGLQCTAVKSVHSHCAQFRLNPRIFG